MQLVTVKADRTYSYHSNFRVNITVPIRYVEHDMIPLRTCRVRTDTTSPSVSTETEVSNVCGFLACRM
jgi:hypothetical protein